MTKAAKLGYDMLKGW